MESTGEKRRNRTYRTVAIMISLMIHLLLGWYLMSAIHGPDPEDQGGDHKIEQIAVTSKKSM